jgi:hypothetical protein
MKHFLHNMCQMLLCAGARFTVYWEYLRQRTFLIHYYSQIIKKAAINLNFVWQLLIITVHFLDMNKLWIKQQIRENIRFIKPGLVNFVSKDYKEMYCVTQIVKFLYYKTLQ